MATNMENDESLNEDTNEIDTRFSQLRDEDDFKFTKNPLLHSKGRTTGIKEKCKYTANSDL